MFSLARALAIVSVALLPVVAVAASTPEPHRALFDSRHLDLIGKGNEVTYRFERTGSDERLVGSNYTDDIRLGVADVNGKGERHVVFRVFTGKQARDPQNWPDLTINPLFIWFLDRNVKTMNTLAGGSQMYLKHRIRESLRDKAKIEPITYDYNGKSVEAFKITVAPFADDMSASKMQGYHNSYFTVVVSDNIPGYFADLHSSFVSTQAAAPKVEEHIKLVGMGEAK